MNELEKMAKEWEELDREKQKLFKQIDKLCISDWNEFIQKGIDTKESRVFDICKKQEEIRIEHLRLSKIEEV